MGLALPDRWIWDSWYAWEGDVCHAFYLCASRALGDPNRRHGYTSVGHAISQDLKTWEILPDALAPSDSPAFDSWTTWTGSIVQASLDKWMMFYTGTSRQDGGRVQRVLAATSNDLVNWTKLDGFSIEADSRFYEKLADETWPDEAWRDPWVYHSEIDQLWHMLVTARAKTPAGNFGGVVGHLTSSDLLNWKVLQPLAGPSSDFAHLEVLQYEVVDGVPLLIFSCDADKLSASRKSVVESVDATYSLVCFDGLENADLSLARPFMSNLVYASRLVRDSSGGWNLLGFRNYENGRFVGEICDPFPVTADRKSGLIPRV